MSEHVFTVGGITPLIINIGGLKFVCPWPDKCTIPNDILPHIDDFFDPYLKPDRIPSVFSGLRPEMDGMPALYLKKRVYGPAGLGLRNLFSPSNPFRRAEWAASAASAGVSTPHVLAIGAKRNGWIIRTVYLALEAISDAEEVTSIFKRPDARARVALFLEDGSRMLAALHKAGIFHGGFRLSHFYYRGAVLSLWNPGWLQSWSGRLSERGILRDLASLGAAVCTASAEHRPALDDFISCDSVAELLLTAYAEVAPGWIPPLGHLTHAIAKNCARKFS